MKDTLVEKSKTIQVLEEKCTVLQSQVDTLTEQLTNQQNISSISMKDTENVSDIGQSKT